MVADNAAAANVAATQDGSVVALDLPDKNDVSEPVRMATATAGVSGPAVLQILPALDESGAERGTIDLARHLVGHGWRALVVSNGGPGEAELQNCGARSFRLPVQANNPLTIRANIRRLQRLIRGHGVRLVHARSRAPAWSAYYAARRCRVPFVTTIHGVYEGGHGIFTRYYNAVMAKGDRVIAVSDYVAEHVRQHYGVPAARLRVIYRGIDIGQFDPGAVDRGRIDALAEHWRVPPGAKVVIVPGRFVHRKGYRLLLQAMDKLPRRDLICLIVGSFDRARHYPGEIEGLIGALDLGSVVRLVGPCDDLPAAFMLADVVVVPSTGEAEPFGRVAVEAQAMGKPVIVTDVAGLGEALMPAATGWLIEPDDPDALANALELALAMPDEARTRLAVRARRFVSRNFSLEQMGNATMRVYRELLEGRPPDGDDELIA
jgi:glycosyltransferase involved in cell wall biosynthesis